MATRYQNWSEFSNKLKTAHEGKVNFKGIFPVLVTIGNNLNQSQELFNKEEETPKPKKISLKKDITKNILTKIIGTKGSRDLKEAKRLENTAKKLFIQKYLKKLESYVGSIGKMFAALGVAPKDGLQDLISSIKSTENVINLWSNAEKIDWGEYLEKIETAYGNKEANFSEIIKIANKITKLIKEYADLKAKAKRAKKLTDSNKFLGEAEIYKTKAIELFEGPFSSAVKKFVEGIRKIIKSVNRFNEDVHIVDPKEIIPYFNEARYEANNLSWTKFFSKEEIEA